MTFEVFDRRPEADLPAMVSVLASEGRSEGLTLTRAAMDLLGRADVVELLFDRDGRVLGMRACPGGSARGFHVLSTRSTRWPWMVERPADFLRNYQVQPGRYPVELRDGVLCADLAPHEK
jgi:hypothetical protein